MITNIHFACRIQIITPFCHTIGMINNAYYMKQKMNLNNIQVHNNIKKGTALSTFPFLQDQYLFFKFAGYIHVQLFTT